MRLASAHGQLSATCYPWRTLYRNRVLACLLVLVGGNCSSAAGSRSPQGNEDAGAVVIFLPDATATCRQSADVAASIDDGGTDPQCTASAPAVSFTNDVMPILTACTGEICHAPWRYDTLVGQHSAACCDHRWLVLPGQPSASHVVQAVEGMGACVSQMPLDEGSLSPPEIATLVAWVCQGALDN